jgi:hypothetical protein
LLFCNKSPQREKTEGNPKKKANIGRGLKISVPNPGKEEIFLKNPNQDGFVIVLIYLIAGYFHFIDGFVGCIRGVFGFLNGFFYAGTGSGARFVPGGIVFHYQNPDHEHSDQNDY